MPEQMPESTSAFLASVIVPAYNAAETLPACLAALRGQVGLAGSFEVIVVDDGSTDQTAALVEQALVDWPALRLMKQENAGPAAARNAGVALALAPIIVFTDADCEPTPFFLACILAPFADSTRKVIGVKGSYLTRQRQLTARFAQLEFEDRFDLLERAPSIDFVDSYAAAFLREEFLAVGGFDLSFPEANNEDVDLSFKLARRGTLVFARRAAVYHRHPWTLRRYLRTKAGRAYWRMKVYAAFPEKALKDSYTPQVLKVQIGLVGLLPPSLLLALLSPWLRLGPVLVLAAFLGSSLPFVLHSFRRDPFVAVLSPGYLLLRSAVFLWGTLRGVWEFHLKARVAGPGTGD